MSRRRVARIITRLNIGGPSIQAITLSRELEGEGLETCLIHGQLGDAEGDMRTLLPMDGVREVQLGDLRREVSPWHDLRALWRLYRTLCAWKPAIVHTHMAKAGALGRIAAVAYNRTAGRQAPARLVHTYHGHVFEGYFGSPSTRVFLFVERWLARHTDVLIAISPQIRTDLLETYRIAREGQVQIVPLGFSLGRFSAIGDVDRQAARRALGVPDGTVVVTTVGRLTAIKQHTLFLQAAVQVTRAIDHVRFLIVGDGELRQALEREAADAGIADRVQFLGWRGDLEVVYGATDVFILTSRNEGTPVALIEAMASGVASVSTDVGGVRDVITDAASGVRVPFGDADALAGALIRLLRSADDRAAMGRQARASVTARFGLDRLVRDIAGVYRQVQKAQA